MNICYIILTHKLTKELEEYLDIIKSEIDIPIHVINTEKNITYTELKEKYPLFEDTYVGNSIFPIIEFSKQYKYDKYIVSEWDTRFTGNHQQLVEFVKNYDVVLQEKYHTCDNWYWHIYTKCPVTPIHCLLQWYSISKTCLEYIENCYNNGWHGHYETVVPTAAIDGHFSIGYLNEKFHVIADWTVTGFKDKLYLYLCHYNNINNCLLHPIKT